MKKYNLKLKFIFLAASCFWIFGAAERSEAADHFIREGAIGMNDGSDWTNAWTTLPATLTRGDTYYIADGAYGPYTFDDPVLGEQYITIKKATAVDYGTATGWSSYYGDGQAVFNGGLTVSSDYWVINGNDDIGWGIVTNYTNNVIGSCAYGILITGANYVSVSSIFAQGDNEPNDDRGTSVTGSTYVNLTHIQESNGGKDFNHIINSNHIIYDDIWIHDGNPYTGQHCDAWEIQPPVSNVTWKNSLIDYEGQLIFWGGTPPVTSYSDFWVYNNIFTGPSPSAGNVGLKGRDPSESYIYNLYVYGNTFVGIYAGFELGLGSGDIKNNLIYNTSTSDSFGDAAHDYNAADYSLGESHSQLISTNPFINLTNGNYRLAAATNSGDSSIGETFNSDKMGNARGMDGVWDIGAYEFVESAPDTTPPASPANLAVQ